MRQSSDKLWHSTFAADFLEIDDQLIAHLSASNELEQFEASFSDAIRFGWCPICLMEDRAGGHDHFVRKEWCLSPVTMCTRHLQPLRERCQSCFSFVDTATFAQYGDQLVLSCPNCQKPLDGMLGYDFVSNTHAVAQAENKDQRKAWQRLAMYEAQGLKQLKDPAVQFRSRVKDRMSNILDLANMLLKAEAGGAIRPVDQVESSFFPSPKKLGYATRHLHSPFSVCHLSERRKVWALLTALVENRASEFGFTGAVYFFETIRDGMQTHTRRRFEQGLLKLTLGRGLLGRRF